MSLLMNKDKDYLEHLAEGRERQRKNREVRRLKYSENPNRCNCCKSEIPYEKKENKYCSRSCAITVNNKGINRHGGKRKNENCPRCGKELYGKHRDAKYCSIECSSISRREKSFSKIEENKNNLSGVSTKTIRSYLKEKFGSICSICNTVMWQGKPVPLVMDHLDGDPYNNSLENIRLVCAMCDAQLPTYKGKTGGMDGMQEGLDIEKENLSSW